MENMDKMDKMVSFEEICAMAEAAIAERQAEEKDRLMEMKRGRFRAFCEARDIPFSREVIPLIDLEEDVQIILFNNAGEFVQQVTAHFNGGGKPCGEFFGQEVDLDHLQFVPARPLGWTKENVVLLSVPGWKWARTDYKFFVDGRKSR